MKKYIVPITTIVSIFFFLFFLVGFSWTMKTQFFDQSNDGNEIKKAVAEDKREGVDDGKVIVALGDSLTRGTGDEEGRGYVGHLVDQLQKKSDEEITVHNLGVTGYRSNQLLNQIKGQEVIRQIGQADIILITIGGNDLFQGGQTILNLDLQEVDKLRTEYMKNLREIVSQIQSVNKDAFVYVVGLYNPFIDLSDSTVTTKVVRQWNFETSELLDQYKNTVFVPTFDLFQLKVNDYLYSDKFHPNTKGYKLIAERVASLITW